MSRSRMEPFTLVVGESREVADRLLAASPPDDDPPPVVALDEPGWFLRLRAFPRQRHVGVVVDSLARPGTMLTALRVVADASAVTWVLARRLVSPEQMDGIVRQLGELGVTPAAVEAMEIGGDPATGVRLTSDAPAPDTWVAALSAAAGLSRLPADSTGCAVRAGFVGRSALRWFGGWARTVVVAPGSTGSLDQICGGDLDVLVIDGTPEEFGREEVAALADEARAMNASVLGIRDHGGTCAPPTWSGLVDLELVGDADLAAEDRLVAVPPIDVRRVNPIGFPPARHRALAAPGPVGEEVTAQVGEVRVLADADPARLREYPAVVDAAGFHPSAAARAERLVQLAAAGVPVVVVDGAAPALRPLLGDRLAAVLSGTDVARVRDPLERERLSVEARRAALREHSMAARWRQVRAALRLPERRRRRVSVVLATHREEFLDHAVEQLNRQTYQPRETVFVLHGDAFDPGTEPRLRAAVDGPVEVVRADGAWLLGDALNAGVDAASGDLVAKMDDDDWYGPEHLADLVLALEYTGAHLVGRAAEFVYLADLDVTIRRFAHESEQPSRKLAGGTLLAAKADLDGVGGWRRAPRRVDTLLIDDVLGAGGHVYRTHGLGFILHRHGRRQTWDSGLDYFLQQSVWQRRGLALADAGVAVD